MAWAREIIRETFILAGGNHLLQVARADPAALHLVAPRPGPVGLQMNVTAVAIVLQCGELPFPVDSAFSERAPHWLMPVERAILRVNVGDAPGFEHVVPVREGFFT